jgi:hypothetical protein
MLVPKGESLQKISYLRAPSDGKETEIEPSAMFSSTLACHWAAEGRATVRRKRVDKTKNEHDRSDFRTDEICLLMASPSFGWCFT